MKDRKSNGGQSKILNEHQVEAIYIYIENQWHAGFPATRAMIHGAVGFFLKQESPPKPMPSSAWTYQFLRGLHQVKKVSTKPLEVKRKVTQDPDVIRVWFLEYVQYLEAYDVYWCDIWNFDEGGFRVGCCKGEDVYVPNYVEEVSALLTSLV